MTQTTLVGDMRNAGAMAQHWIDGRWRDSAEPKDSVNPATGEVIGRYALAGEDEAREATAAARRAFREMEQAERIADEWFRWVSNNAADLIALVSIETGKVVGALLTHPIIASAGGFMSNGAYDPHCEGSRRR